MVGGGVGPRDLVKVNVFALVHCDGGKEVRMNVDGDVIFGSWDRKLRKILKICLLCMK